MALRLIFFQRKIDHTTIINWVKQVGEKLPQAPEIDKIPSVGELDELETFVGSTGGTPTREWLKKTKFGYGQP